jgi:hypothetical protein
MFEVICIDDSNRPNDIPLSSWIKKGDKYTVIGVYKMGMQPGIFGYEIEGKNLKPYPPYQYFAHVRFAIIEDLTIKEESKEETREPELV